MKKLRIILPFITLLLFFISCSKGNDGGSSGGTMLDCSGAAKTFSGDVNPLVQTFCNQASCHASGSTNGPGPLTNYNQVFGARNVIRNAVFTGLMPQNATLSNAQRSAIICWIDSGAPNN